MPRRKRGFESLEDRRLLATLAATAEPSSVAADPNPAASNSALVSTSPGTNGSTAAGDSGASASTDASPDSYAEYASAPQSGYGSSSYGSSSSYAYGDSYDPTANYDNTPGDNTAAYKTPSNSTTSPPSGSAAVQPSNSPSQPTIVEAANAQPNPGLPGVVVAPAPSTAAPPAATASPPVAGSPSTAKITDDESAKLQQPVALEEAGEDQALLPPVATTNAPRDWRRVSDIDARQETSIEQAAVAMVETQLDPREPIARSLAFNSSAIEREIDEVFDRLDRLGNELAAGVESAPLAHWLIISGGACAAFEYARARFREGGSWQYAQGGWPMPVEPRLRRRWFSRRGAR